MAELKLAIGVDTKQAIRETKNFGNALDGLADDFEDAARKGDLSVDDMIKSLRELSRQAKIQGDKTGDNLAKGIDSGLDEARGEATSSGREAAASFGGSFDDATGYVQETLANAFGGFGPGGVAFGIVAAAGVGIATALFQKAKDDELALEERANDLAAAYIAAGSTVLDELAIADRSQEILTSTDPKVKTDLKTLTDNLGDQALAVRVLAGDKTALATANEILAGTDSTAAEKALALAQANGTVTQDIEAAAYAAESFKGVMDEVNGTTDEASKKQQTHSEILRQVIDDATEAAVQTDEFGNQLITLPSGAQIVIEAETGTATTDVDNFKGDVDTIPVAHTTDIEVGVNKTAWNNFKTEVENWDPNKTIRVAPVLDTNTRAL